MPTNLSPKLDARRAALGALYDVFYKDAYAQIALNRQIEEINISDDDKRLATVIFYLAIENRLQLEYYLKKFVREKPEPVIEAILYLSAAQILYTDKIPDFAAVNEAANLAKSFGFERQTGFVNGVLRSLIRARDAGELTPPDFNDDPAFSISVASSVPEALVNKVAESYGMDFARDMFAYTPKTRFETVRPNLLRHTPQSFEEYMKKRGWEFSPSPVPGVYYVSGQGNLAMDPDFGRGEYSVQGPASFLAARAVGAKPGMNVLDACAAPGGKTVAMAEMMRGTGRVYAWDAHEHRADIVLSVAKRLGLDNVRPAVRDASKLRPSMVNEMDAVLVDAPCSGLGVIANKPDLKFRYVDDESRELIKTQKRILDACSNYVRPGGVLVYSTCTVLPEENSGQIRAFLDSHPEFSLSPFEVPEKYKSGFKDGMLSLHAHIHGDEGFFIARMVKND